MNVTYEKMPSGRIVGTVAHGVTDPKGRKLGHDIIIRDNGNLKHAASLTDAQRAELAAKGSVRVETGPYTSMTITTDNAKAFEVWAWSTRDGKTFGAIPRSHYAATVEEAKAIGEGIVSRAAKRIQANAAKNGGVYVTGTGSKSSAKSPSLVRNVDYIDRFGDES